MSRKKWAPQTFCTDKCKHAPYWTKLSVHSARSIWVIVAKFHTITDFQFLQIVVTAFSYRHDLSNAHHFYDVILLINKMLSKEDRVLIEVLRVEKGYGAKRIMTEFLGRNFSLAYVKLGWLRAAVWGILQKRVYRCQIRDVDHLKERLIAEWRRIDQNIIDRAVNQWRERLHGVSGRTEDTVSIKFKRSDYLTWQQLCLLIEFLTGFI